MSVIYAVSLGNNNKMKLKLHFLTDGYIIYLLYINVSRLWELTNFISHPYTDGYLTHLLFCQHCMCC